MNTIQKITKNIGILSISQILSYVLGFFTLVYSANYLGVEGFGTLSLAMALTGIFSVTMDLGLSTLTIREVARDKTLTNDYMANLTLLKIISTIITFLFIILIIHLFGYNQETIQIIYLITLYTIFNIFSQQIYSFFQAHEKMEYQSIGNILINILILAGVLLAIYFQLNIIKFSSIYPIASALILFYAFLTFSWEFNLPKLHFDKKKWISLIKEAWPFAITNISINMYLWIDSVILSLIVGSEAVGLYNASYKLIIMLLIIPIIFNTAVFPVMSRYYISSIKSLNIIFDKLFKIMFLTALPIGVGTFLIADKIIILIYGEQFIGAVIILQILIWSTVLSFARSPYAILLESSNRQFTVTQIFVIGVIFNVILNLMIIPIYSYVGAAITTVLTDVLIIGLLIRATQGIGFSISKSTKKSLIKITAASLIMGITLKYLSNLNLFTMIIIGFMIYVSVLFVLKIVDEDEISLIKSIYNE